MAQLDETLSDGHTVHVAFHEQLHKKANYVFDVMDYGATGDGSTDDTAAIQAAIDAAEAAAGGTVVCPHIDGSYYLTSAPLTVNANDITIEGFSGNQLEGSTIRNNTTDVLQLATSASVSKFRLRGMCLVAGAAGTGAVKIVGVVSMSTFEESVFATYTSTSYCLWAEGGSWELLDSLFVNCVYDADAGNLTVPMVSLVTTAGGVLNQNTWLGGRFISSLGATEPCVLISNRDTSSYLYGNTFRGINFEVANAGAIHAQGCYGLHVEDCGVYDISTATDHIFSLTKHADGIAGRFNYITNTHRIGGSIGANYDIYLFQENFDTVINSGGLNTGKIHFNGARHTLIAPVAVTVDGIPALTYIDAANDTIGMLGVIIKVGSGAPEGAVTAAVGSTFMRTDGSANTSFYVKESGTGNTGWVAK